MIIKYENKFEKFSQGIFEIKREDKKIQLAKSELLEINKFNVAEKGRLALESLLILAEDDDVEVIKKMMQSEYICYSIANDIFENLSIDYDNLLHSVTEDYIKNMKIVYSRIKEIVDNNFLNDISLESMYQCSNEVENFNILIYAEDETQASEIAKEYFLDSALENDFKIIRMDGKNKITHFDCDYLLTK